MRPYFAEPPKRKKDPSLLIAVCLILAFIILLVAIDPNEAAYRVHLVISLVTR